ncbi:unnamed protein product [Acanthosepion pharaonis]|uniref:RING-type domain-containing protein n=1 Tax=Acanthosepion pharaonis TaxID=158019 RepID=A0A812BPY0_ACAPH|nr:unnamed protein product [Sepia pharaonis]
MEGYMDSCPSCHLPFDKGKKRRLIDSCGHERCYSCMFDVDKCPLCDSAAISVKPNGHFSRQSSTESGVFNHNRPKLKTNGHFTTYMQTRMDISPASEIANPLVLQPSPKMVTRNTAQPGLALFFFLTCYNLFSISDNYYYYYYCHPSFSLSSSLFPFSSISCWQGITKENSLSIYLSIYLSICCFLSLLFLFIAFFPSYFSLRFFSYSLILLFLFPLPFQFISIIFFYFSNLLSCISVPISFFFSIMIYLTFSCLFLTILLLLFLLPCFLLPSDFFSSIPFVILSFFSFPFTSFHFHFFSVPFSLSLSQPQLRLFRISSFFFFSKLFLLFFSTIHSYYFFSLSLLLFILSFYLPFCLILPLFS